MVYRSGRARRSCHSGLGDLTVEEFEAAQKREAHRHRHEAQERDMEDVYETGFAAPPSSTAGGRRRGTRPAASDDDGPTARLQKRWADMTEDGAAGHDDSDEDLRRACALSRETARREAEVAAAAGGDDQDDEDLRRACALSREAARREAEAQEARHALACTTPEEEDLERVLALSAQEEQRRAAKEAEDLALAVQLSCQAAAAEAQLLPQTEASGGSELRSAAAAAHLLDARMDAQEDEALALALQLSQAEACTAEELVDFAKAPQPPTGSHTSARPQCWYGAKCYRRGEEHRQRYSHPGDDDFDHLLPHSTAGPGPGGEEPCMVQEEDETEVIVVEDIVSADSTSKVDLEDTGADSSDEEDEWEMVEWAP